MLRAPPRLSSDLEGVLVTAGSTIAVNIGSANHDERYWENPEEFDMRRPQHVEFLGVLPVQLVVVRRPDVDGDRRARGDQHPLEIGRESGRGAEHQATRRVSQI